MGWIQSDQLPGLPVGADLLGTGQDRYDLFIGPLLQQLSLVKGFDQTEGQERGQEVAELASYNGVVILHPGLIEFTGGFIEPHDDLDLPALFVGFISSLSGKVQVAFQNDRPESLLLLPEHFKTVGLVLLCPAQPVPLLFGSFVAVTVGVKPFIRPGALFLPEGDPFISGEDAGKVQHVVPFNKFRIAFDRVQVMKVFVCFKVFMRR